MRSHGWYDLPPFIYEREKGILSTVVAAGTPAPPLSRGKDEKASEVAFRVHSGRLEARSDGLDAAAQRAIARRVFSLDLDLADAERSFAHEPAFADALAERGGRMLRAPTLFEDAVKMLFTTNCSWGATRGMVSRLIALAGAEGRAFPTPDAVARLSTASIERHVRCGYRTEALRLFARRVASGRLDLSSWENPQRPSEEVREAIAEERGFGPYAAEGLLRILGHHDFFALDSWTRQQYRRRYPGRAASTDSSIARRYARFGRHRGLAMWLDMTSHWHDRGS